MYTWECTKCGYWFLAEKNMEPPLMCPRCGAGDFKRKSVGGNIGA